MAHPLFGPAGKLYNNFQAAGGKSVFDKTFKGASDAKKVVVETQMCHFDTCSGLVGGVQDSVIVSVIPRYVIECTVVKAVCNTDKNT